jgi:hypothetical protein
LPVLKCLEDHILHGIIGVLASHRSGDVHPFIPFVMYVYYGQGIAGRGF